MITVTVYKKEKMYRGFTVKGHADYAKEGSDIICSAVSALTITTANSIEKFTEDHFEEETAKDGGFLQMLFPEGVHEKASLLMDAFLLGIESIQNQYGEKYLTLKVEEV